MTERTDKEKLEDKVRYILATHRVPQNSRRMSDYEQGKALLYGYQLSGGDYFRAVKVVSDWVGV